MSGWLSCSCPQQPQGSAATSDSSDEAWVAELVARPAGCRPATLTATEGARPRMGARPPSSSAPPTEGWARPLAGARPQSASTPNVQIEVLPATSRATGGAHPQASAHSRSASSSRARGRGCTLPPPREGGSASSRRARRPRHDSGFPLDGDEARMIRDLGFYLAGLDHSSQILCGSLRTLIREATLPSVEKAWSSLVVSLREVVDGMLANPHAQNQNAERSLWIRGGGKREVCQHGVARGFISSDWRIPGKTTYFSALRIARMPSRQ